MKKQIIIYIVIVLALSTLSLNIFAKSSNQFKSKDNRVEVIPTGESNFSQIKEASKEDIVKGIITYEGEKVKVEYVKNQLVFFSKDGVSFDKVKEMLKKHDGVIVGYMSDVDNYQVEFLNCTINDLEKKIVALQKENILDSDSILLNIIAEHSVDKMRSAPSVIEGK